MPNETLFTCRFKVPRHSSKKNEKRTLVNRKTGRAFIGKTERAKLCEDWMLQKLRVEKLKQGIETITCDVSVSFKFGFPKSVYFTKKGFRSKTLPDLSNLYELVQDCLEEVGIIENDTQIVSHDGSARHPVEGTEYWLEISVKWAVWESVGLRFPNGKT